LQTLLPLAAASIASAFVYVAMAASLGDLHFNGSFGGILGIVILTAVAFLSAFVFVLPVMTFVPRLRLPPLWIAAIWGASAAVVCGAIGRVPRISYGYLIAMGLAAGTVYSITAHRLCVRNRSAADVSRRT